MSAGDWREWQEPVLRWTATGVFATCAIVFCTTLGDLSFTGSLGWFFGVLFSGVPGFVLWGRELYEAGVRRDRAEMQGQGRRFVAESDEPPGRAFVEDHDEQSRASRVRSVDYYDEDDD